MPGPPYYGSVSTLKILNRNVESFAGSNVKDFDAQVQAFDEVVLPDMLGRLAVVYSSLPAPTGKAGSVLATLWVFGMSALIQPAKSSAQRPGGSSITKTTLTWEDRYEKLLKRILKGEEPIPGSIRSGSPAAHAAGMPQRTRYSDPRPTGPRPIGSLFQHGLRLAPNDTHMD